MINPKDERLIIGVQVVYKRPHMELGESGLISSLHALPQYIHVRFGVNAVGAACSPEDLFFTHE